MAIPSRIVISIVWSEDKASADLYVAPLTPVQAVAEILHQAREDLLQACPWIRAKPGYID